MGADLSRQRACGEMLMDKLVEMGKAYVEFMMKMSPDCFPDAERWSLNLMMYSRMRQVKVPFQACVAAAELNYVTQDAISLLFRWILKKSGGDTFGVRRHLSEYVRVGYCPEDLLQHAGSRSYQTQKRRHSACFYSIM